MTDEGHLDRAGMAERLGISVRVLDAETRAGRIPHLRIGRTVTYPVAAVVEWERTKALASLAQPPLGFVVDRPRRGHRRAS